MSVLPERTQKAKRFGRNLQKLRHRAEITQEQLAEKAGVSPRYVQAIETGRRLPSVYIADALRRAAKASWDELL